MAEEGQETTQELSMDELATIIMQSQHKFMVQIIRDFLAEAFPRSDDPHRVSSIKGDLAFKVNWLLEHAITDCEHPDFEHRGE